MIDHNNKNFILAIVLSMAIIFGWQYFYAIPIAEQARQETTTAQPNTTTTPTTTAQVPGAATAVTPVTRDQALTTSPRLKIETPELQGSINLTGAQLDDLHLTRYRETINPRSPTIVLLSPAGTPNAFFAEQGFVGATGTTAKLPDSKTLWQAPADAVLGVGKPVTLTWDNGDGLVFTRQISINDHYVFSVTQGVQNNSAAPVALIPYARVQRQDTPVIAGWWVFFEGMLGVLGDKLQEINYSDVLGVKEPLRIDSQGGWLGFTDKYWAAVMIPDQTRAITTSFLHQVQNGRDVYQTDYLAKDAVIIQPGATGLYQDQLFAGAKVVKTVQAIGEKYKIAKFDLMIDWGWFEFITKPMFYLLDFLNGIIGNFGIAILIATVLVKLAVFPLANKSYASMSKMKKLQPEMAKLKELYPDDKMKQQQGMMELYKREKVSPISGCLPVVVQIPVFFALYKVILTSIELRHAPFFGWIHDLSAADPTNLFNLFGIIPWTPPLFLALGVWPLLMGVTMWVQMRLNPTPPDPVQASLFNWMPVMFTFMLGSFPAGLVIYWAWSNFLSILQQSVIMRRHGVEIDLLGNIRDSLPFLKKETSGHLTLRFTSDQLLAGRRLFSAPSTFMLGVAALDQLPPAKGVEIAFAGRSNVGKSSLINALTGVRELARASNTPGRTRELNFFNIADALTLIDMPGYGYAKAPKKEVKKWQSMLRGYLRGRPGLTRAFVLIDARHGVLAADEEMFDLLDESAVTYQLVLTKIDKLKPAEVGKIYAETEAAVKKRSAAFPLIHATSSEKFTGLEELRAEIAGLL